LTVVSAISVYDATPQITFVQKDQPAYDGGPFYVEIYGQNFGSTPGSLLICAAGAVQCSTTEIAVDLHAPFSVWNDGQVNALLTPSPSADGPYEIQIVSLGASGINFAPAPQGQTRNQSDRGQLRVDGVPSIESIEPSVFYQEPKGVLPMSKTMTIRGKRLMSSAPGALPPNVTDSRGDFNFQLVTYTPDQIVIKYTLDRRALPLTHTIGVTRVPGGTGSKNVTVLPRTYVVLVHGISQNGSAMASLTNNLSSVFQQTPGMSFDNGFSLNVSGAAGIAESAQALMSYVSQSLLAQSGSKIVFVGYSMGGLLARQVILDPGFFFRLQYNTSPPTFVGLVTLGTPNLGYPFVSGLDDALYPFINPSQATDMSGDFRAAPLALSPFLSSMRANWEAFYTNTTAASIPWLAASGKSCNNPLRMVPNPDLSITRINRGCRDANPYSDGVVCDDSAGWAVPQGQPTSRWADPTNKFQHTSSSFGGLGVLCAGRADINQTPVLFDPPVGTDLFDQIVLFIGSLGT